MLEAREHLERETQLADSLGQPGMRWYAYYHTSLLALVEGRLEAAERWAERAAEVGSDGEPEALMLYGATIAACALEGGREDEVVELLEQSTEDSPGLPPFAGALILAYARVGREDDARELLGRWRDGRLETMPHDIVWTSAPALFTRPVAELGDREAASQLRPMLLPLRGLCCSNGATGFGTVDQCLGLLAVTEGDHDSASEYFAAAAEFEMNADMQASLALTRLWWARSLFARGGPENEEKARTLLEASMESSRKHGYARYLREAEALLVEHVSA